MAEPPENPAETGSARWLLALTVSALLALPCTGGGVISTWHYHEILRVGDRVYNGITGPDGMSLDEYRMHFRRADDIHFPE